MFPETTVSLDALRSLQLERLRGALRHAYDNQAPYRAKCVAAGIHPDDLPNLVTRLEACLRGERPDFESEHRIRTRAGGWIWTLSRGRGP